MPDAAALAAAAQILIRIDTGEKNTAQELDELWPQLPTVRIEEILGSWRGGELPTGHPMDGQLEQVGWYGKNFISRTNAAAGSPQRRRRALLQQGAGQG